MLTENFNTRVVEFDRDWIDKYGLVSLAYDWAVQHLEPGTRLIGTRLLTFANRLDIYRFDIRNHPEKGVTVECETPARCATVIRVNERHMIVQHVLTNEIVQKYVPCIDEQGNRVWRLWHAQRQEYHIETELPAVNFNVFLLQCNQAVLRLSRDAGGRDWFGDVKRRVHLSNMRENTPKAVQPLLKTLTADVEAFYNDHTAPTKVQLGVSGSEQNGALFREYYLTRYQRLLKESIEFIIAAGAGQPLRR